VSLVISAQRARSWWFGLGLALAATGCGKSPESPVVTPQVLASAPRFHDFTAARVESVARLEELAAAQGLRSSRCFRAPSS
jgi:hypothetical protein